MQYIIIDVIWSFTEFPETTTVQDTDGVSKHRLVPTSPTFYNVTLINNYNSIPIELENAS